MTTHYRHKERGSAIILIFLAVGLFGALSFAVSSIMSTGDPNTIAQEKAKLYAGEILDYGRTLRQAVQDLKIMNGCTDEDLSFENDVVSGYEHASGTRNACKVFHASGGAMSYLPPQAEWLDPTLSAQPLFGISHFPEGNCVRGVGTDGSGDPVHGFCDNALDSVDILYSVLYLNKQVCEEINETLFGSRQIYDVQNHGISSAYFNGVINTHGREIADAGTDINGQQAMCVRSGWSGTHFPAVDSYHFYQVLVAR